MLWAKWKSRQSLTDHDECTKWNICHPTKVTYRFHNSQASQARHLAMAMLFGKSWIVHLDLIHCSWVQCSGVARRLPMLGHSMGTLCLYEVLRSVQKHLRGSEANSLCVRWVSRLEACGGHGGQNRDILRACNVTTKPRALLWLSLASYVCHASMHIRHEYQALLRLAIKIPGKTFLILYNCSLTFHKSTTHKYIYLLLRLKQLTHRSWHWLLFGEGLVLLSDSLKWHCCINVHCNDAIPM